MSEHAESYRRILKSSSIIGGASAINVIIGLFRTKIIALLLGPAGFGLVSLYWAVISTASVLASMGIGTVGTRQIAEAITQEDERRLKVVRNAMFWGTLLLAIAGALVIWSLREVLAKYVLGDIDQAFIVGWLSIGVALSVAVASQGALIQGMRRIGDMARLSVYGSVLNTLLGIGFIFWLGKNGLIVYVLVGPLVSFLLGCWYVSRLPKLLSTDIALQEMLIQWKTLMRLGIPFMGASVVNTLVQLWIRIEVGNNLGPDSLGYFQAAWSISMQYIGFVLVAMGADYYPRLTGIIHDHDAVTRLVNQQTEIALLLSAPVFILMIGLTPLLIHLLYSAEFLPAVDVLRWQILGDVLKVASWPLGFVILAAGAGKTFFWTESLALLTMGGLIAGFSYRFGLQVTGVAFLVTYAVYLPLVYGIAKYRMAFQWSLNVKLLLLTIFLTCTFVAVLSHFYIWASVIAVVFALIFGVYALLRLVHMSALDGKFKRISDLSRRVFFKFGLKK